MQNRNERPNLSTNNRDMAEIDKHPVNDDVTKLGCDIYVIRVKLSF